MQISLEREIHLSAQGAFLLDVSQATKLQYTKTPFVIVPLKLAPLPALARVVNGNVLLPKPGSSASLLVLLTSSSLTFNNSTSPIIPCPFPNSSHQHLSPGLLLHSANCSSWSHSHCTAKQYFQMIHQLDTTFVNPQMVHTIFRIKDEVQSTIYKTPLTSQLDFFYLSPQPLVLSKIWQGNSFWQSAHHSIFPPNLCKRFSWQLQWALGRALLSPTTYKLPR